MSLPVYDLSEVAGRTGFEQCLDRLRYGVTADSQAAETTATLIADVRQNGDEAVVRYMRRWTDQDFTADRIVVTADELAGAEERLDPGLREAILTGIEHIRAYQEHIAPQKPKAIKIGGARLGLRFNPVDSVGLTVPGGTAPLFSTLMMLAVPAQVAGVPSDRITVVNPPPTTRPGQPAGDISVSVLATAKLLGIERVFRIGGAQAVAALAFGTERVPSVDMIAGPGNVYVQQAKQQVAGICGTDGGFYGPSEIVTIADENADPLLVASDLIAQAEHDPGKCFLVTWSAQVIERIAAQITAQLRVRKRLSAIQAALREQSGAVLAADQAQAIDVANRLAPEHLHLAVAEPSLIVAHIRHAGQIFLGEQTPVASGDYYAGPSHCLPTGTTARFASGVSVYTFLKRTGMITYPSAMSAQTIRHIAKLSEAEGLDGHAASVRQRGR